MSVRGTISTTRTITPVSVQRVRVRLARTGPASSLSHLRQIEVFRRALENSSWPASRTRTKRSKLRVAFGPAISVGYESESEYFDVELESRLDLKTAKADLQDHLIEGYTIMDVKSIPRFFPSLEQSVNVARYEIRSDLLETTRTQWESFWDRPQFLIEKKKAETTIVIDARALVKSWHLEEGKIDLVLRFGPRRTLKPERIVQSVCGFREDDVGIGYPTSNLRIKRTHLYFEKQNGDLTEP